ncbi:MAG: HEAT repeat domain-containing protein [Kiritimatiellae bacterium]|nr:HEAT repeat domain-containing protein [Kiritimatiellia bacterium]
MFIKFAKRFCFILPVFSIVATSWSQSPAPKTYRDYPEWAEFPDAIDFEDEAAVLQYRRFVEKGESAYDALMAVVRECDDSCLVGTALGILRESKGDKRAVVAELKEIFAKRLPQAEGDEAWIMIYMAKTIAETGGEEDAAALIPMLEHPRWEIRVNGARFLGRLGGQRALEALECAKTRPQNQEPTEKDAIEEAISTIEKRLKKQE